MKIIGKVLESSPSTIIVKIDENENFEKNKNELQIGKYLQIQNGNMQFLLAAILNIKIYSDELKEKFIINCQPIGVIDEEKKFKSGIISLPSPTEKVYVPEKETLNKVFSMNENFSFEIGKLVQNKEISLFINGNKFFSKHIGIVGSTGSGKSCTVARILQDVIGINHSKNLNKEKQKNSHIIIFDIHSEYKAAFTLKDTENFTLNVLDVEKLKLPYWLLNSEELEALFIESNEQNSHNQISQFKKAVILNKEKYNPDLRKLTYDTPVYFSLKEVYNYIYNMNEEVINKKANEEHLPKLSDGTLVDDREKYFEKIYNFAPTSTAAASKASKGPFAGDFDRFISRFETKLNDKRLKFILNPKKEDENEYQTNDFEEILMQFLGYLNKSNITIIDLSGIPFEVLSITVSLISRLVFDFAFHYSKLKHMKNENNDIPFMIVCEEAHNYIPKAGGSEYKASKKSIERIAKEGRKYGLSLMVVSQRPSEVSDTIYSQCNNFIALRLTNINDQNYIKNLLPDNSSSIAEILPSLMAGECLVVGDATPISAIVKMEKPNPEPRSESIKFHSEWKEEWKEISSKNIDSDKIIFSDVIKRWKKE